MKTKEIYMYALGAIIVIGFFSLLGLLIFRGVPEINKDILNIVIGTLIGSFGTIITYFFGSSLGSKNKTELMAKTDPIKPADDENK